MEKSLKLSVQATGICIDNTAFLIRGNSGVGKSSLALSLIKQGGKLISDDIVTIQLVSDKLMAIPHQKYRGCLEVRSVGIVSGFPVCESAPIGAVITITEKMPERLPQKDEFLIADRSVPHFYLWRDSLALQEQLWAVVQVVLGRLKIMKGL